MCKIREKFNKLEVGVRVAIMFVWMVGEIVTFILGAINPNIWIANVAFTIGNIIITYDEEEQPQLSRLQHILPYIYAIAVFVAIIAKQTENMLIIVILAAFWMLIMFINTPRFGNER